MLRDDFVAKLPVSFISAFNHIFCFYNSDHFVSTTSPLSKFRNQTHVVARTLARPVENKVLLEVFLVEEIIDCAPKLVFV